MKILVVEDEQKLAGFITSGLQQAGYLVTQCTRGDEALRNAASEDFDLMLLDLMLPGMNGFDVLKNLRSFKIQVPVIILSALGSTEQVVSGLDLGAVDFIRKPFEWAELLARIRAVQRKLFQAQEALLQLEDLTLDLLSRKVSRAGKEIELTQKEFLLLEYLARNANRVVSKNQLLEQAWGINFDPDSNIVEVFMYQLRKKIDRHFNPPLIKTVIGTGYMLKGNKPTS